MGRAEIDEKKVYLVMNRSGQIERHKRIKAYKTLDRAEQEASQHPFNTIVGEYVLTRKWELPGYE